MDVIVAVKRPGYRNSRRRIAMSKIPSSHKVTKEDSISFFKDKYGVEVL
jgi:large subunit ribosomal protein L5